MNKEEEHPSIQDASITLTISHDAAVAIGAAAIYCRSWFAPNPEMKDTIAHLDEVYHLLMQQPQLSALSREMRRLVAGLNEKRGGS